MGDKPLKAMQKIKKTISKVKTSKAFLAIICLAIGISYTVIYYEGGNFYQDYFTPKSVTIIIHKAEAKVKKATPKDNVTELANKIYYLESSNGKNNYSKCEAIGKVNGIGFGIIGNGKYECFNSHEDEMKVLKGWIVDHKARGMSDNELLCLYSGNNYKICK